MCIRDRSHLTSSNDYKNTSNNAQLDKIIELSNLLPNIKLSLANTGGIKLGTKFCLDQTRPGIGLFGIDSYGQNIRLLSKDLILPFELHAPIIQIRNVNINQPISYNGIEKTKRKSTFLWSLVNFLVKKKQQFFRAPFIVLRAIDQKEGKKSKYT